jgi:predicted esterase
MGDPARVQASYDQYIKGPGTQLIWYDEGHGLGDEWVQDALGWLQERL